MCTVAAVKIAQKIARIPDRQYRDIIRRLTGQDSSTRCTPEQRSDILREIIRISRQTPGKHPSTADARKKLWALWCQLRQTLPQPFQTTQYLVGICRKANFNVPTITRTDTMNAIQIRRAIEALKARIGQ